jgi:hypothetical protein
MASRSWRAVPWPDWAAETFSSICIPRRTGRLDMTSSRNIPLEDFYELLKPPIYGLGATNGGVADYCDLMGWGSLKILVWQRAAPNVSLTRSAGFRRVAQTDRIGPKRKSKPAYFARATKLFPGLSCATLNAARAMADDKKATLVAALEGLRSRGQRGPHTFPSRV